MSLPVTILRPLGHLEAMYVKGGRYGLYGMTTIFFVSSKVEIKETMIKQAMRVLMRRHPLLRSGVAERGSKLYWTEDKNREPQLHIGKSGNWLGALDNYTRMRYKYEEDSFNMPGPLWTVTYVPNVLWPYQSTDLTCHSAFVMDTHHAAVDGQVIIQLVRDLKDMLCLQESSLLNINLNNVSSKEVPKPLDSYIPLSLKERTLLHARNLPIIKQCISKQICGQLRNRVPFEKCVVDACDESYKQINNALFIDKALIKSNEDRDRLSLRAGFEYNVLNVDETTKLIKTCKAKNFTVHTVLQTAATIATCRLLVNLAKERGIDVAELGKGCVDCGASLTPSSLTDTMCTDESYAKCMFYSIFHHVNIEQYAKDDCDFWLAAESLSKLLKKKRTSGDSVKKSFLASAHEQEYQHLFPTKLNNMIGVSNIGNITELNAKDRSNHGDNQLQITGLFCVCKEQYFGPLFQLVLLTLDSQLMFGLTYYPHLTRTELAVQCLNTTVQMLREKCIEQKQTQRTTKV